MRKIFTIPNRPILSSSSHINTYLGKDAFQVTYGPKFPIIEDTVLLFRYLKLIDERIKYKFHESTIFNKIGGAIIFCQPGYIAFYFIRPICEIL